MINPLFYFFDQQLWDEKIEILKIFTLSVIIGK